MLCPGVYPLDPTLGITDPEMLPPRSRPCSRNYPHRPCPECGKSCPRDRVRTRTLHDLGDPVGGRPRDIHLTYSQHHCSRCCHYHRRHVRLGRAQGHPSSWLGHPHIVETATYQPASWHFLARPSGLRPFATIQNWVEAREKRRSLESGADYLDWALDGFSGYIAADELYDGPFCVLSDRRQPLKRLCYEVLDHAPAHRDIVAFFQRFQVALTGRGLTLHGITTDGSELYPQPIFEVFAAVKHQVCRFHILLEPANCRPRAPSSGLQALGGMQEAEAPPRAASYGRRRRRPFSASAAAAEGWGKLLEHRHLFVKRQAHAG